MSGTSLDGLDLAFCDFKDSRQFRLEKFAHVPYPKEWVRRLSEAHDLSALELLVLERDYSEFTAQHLSNFIEVHQIDPEFIGCHGHTIFHRPNENITHQILDGSIIAARTGCITVCDFRSLDVALGGQGAPLVPVGDELLFHQYDACLNVGGFANISFKSKGVRTAFDICPANIVMNYLSKKLGLDYDENGKIASQGIVNETILDSLNDLKYFKRKAPKSLGREWVEEEVFPLIGNDSAENLLATFVAHIADQCAASIREIGPESVLTTGGGAHNKFLLKEIAKRVDAEILLPSKEIIDYKEAIIFAFLAKLRLDEHTNTLCSVTGARRNSCGGAMYLPR